MSCVFVLLKLAGFLDCSWWWLLFFMVFDGPVIGVKLRDE